MEKKKISLRKTYGKRQCPRCGYRWTAIVAKPKSCPECKTRLSWWKKEKE